MVKLWVKTVLPGCGMTISTEEKAQLHDANYLDLSLAMHN